MDVDKNKTFIKKEVRKAAFKEFKLLQAGHEKGNKTIHGNMEKKTQIISTYKKLTNKQSSLLFNLRCQSEKKKKNKKFTNDILVI